MLDTKLQNPTALGPKFGKAGSQPFVLTAREVFKPPQLQLCSQSVLHHVTLGTMLQAPRWERPDFTGKVQQQQELAVGCFLLGLPPLPRDYPAGFSTGMKSSCLLACLQIKGSKGIPAEYAPVGISVGNSGKHTRSGTEKGDQGHLKT